MTRTFGDNMKKFDTKEECLNVMGEHCMENNDGFCRKEGCLVNHVNSIPFRFCRHCPFKQTLVISQQEIKEWKEDS